MCYEINDCIGDTRSIKHCTCNAQENMVLQILSIITIREMEQSFELLLNVM